MKILLIDVNYKNSSTGKLVYDLKSLIDSSNHQAFIAYGRGKKTKDKNVFKFAYTFETYLDALLTRLTGLVGYFSFFSTLNLIKLIKRIKPDVIHIHELHAYFINIPMIVGFIKSLKIKVIWTLHSDFMFTGKCGNSLSCDKWKIECKKCPLKKDYPKSLFFDFSNFMFKHKKILLSGFENLTIVTPSDWLKNRVSFSFLKSYKIVKISNGIDTDNIFNFNLYKEQSNGFKDIPFSNFILAVAPNIMSKSKGGNYVIEIAKSLSEFNFIMVGFDRIPLNLPKNIYPLKRTENQKILARLYSMASLFLITSQMETFSLTCAESLCCGTSIVGFDVGAIKETIQDSTYGNLVSYGNYKMLVEIIKNFNNNLSNKSEISNFGRKKFNLKDTLSQYLKLYNENFKN
jgi:putative colanic acid biosynthesis glycosyltransferase